MYRIVSNFTQIAEVESLAEAKRTAVDESLRFDDVITIERNGGHLYMASGGRLFRLVVTR